MTEDRNNQALNQLLAIMDRLRDPDSGCPWDLQQTFATIAPHTLEETYEVLDAIEQNQFGQLAAELGDLLFQVVFYAQLGKEQNLFDFAGIADGISDKLLRRHPHVFPSGQLDTTGGPVSVGSEQVTQQWEAIKAEERQLNVADSSILADIPVALTALLRAAKLQKRAARVGMDWANAGELGPKILEELEEVEVAASKGDALAIEEEVGDLLFTVVNLARHLNVDAESALRKANRKFEKRIRFMEQQLDAENRVMETLDSSELDKYWELAKQALHGV